MKMGLLPLEYTDCLTDSPYFRENLHAHEKELEKTSQHIKGLIKDVKDLLSAARNLSRAQRSLSQNLQNFRFECIGSTQTDDEIVIAGSLKEFGRLIAAIEDERDRMLERAHDQFIVPLESFRKEHIGGVKEGKKKFEKQTTKFCQSQERYLNLSTKKQDTVLQEADATLEMEQRHFCQASLEYIFLLQEVQERKKFEFVETLLGFMYGWLTFYHQGHEVAKDFKPYMTELQIKIQKTRENFNSTRDQAECLKNKMLEVRKTKPLDPGTLNKMYTRQGYLFLMEKKAFGTTWTKHYCQYQKENRNFSMIPYNQVTGKFSTVEVMRLKSCVKRIPDSIEKRFCFDVTADDRPGIVYTLQAISEEDRKLWMDAMDGREPTNFLQVANKTSKPEETCLDEMGFKFVSICIGELEKRGLEDQGLYRLVGVGSKVNKLLQMGLDRRKIEKLNLEDPCEWESKTITSALKTYFRNLPEPLMTFRSHNAFIAAAKQEAPMYRINDVHTLTHRLPQPNQKMLEILTFHLKNVAAKADKNRMTVSNLGVCFGPTLLRPEEETMAAIMDIKFCNVVVEILVENCDTIFRTQPLPASEMAAQSMPRVDVRPPKPPKSPSPPSSGSSPASPASHGSYQQYVHHHSHQQRSGVNNNGQHQSHTSPVRQGQSGGGQGPASPPVVNSMGQQKVSPLHAVITSYNDGPRPVVVTSGLMHQSAPRSMYSSSMTALNRDNTMSIYNNGGLDPSPQPPVRISSDGGGVGGGGGAYHVSNQPNSNSKNLSVSETRLWPGEGKGRAGQQMQPVSFYNRLATGDRPDRLTQINTDSSDSSWGSKEVTNHVGYSPPTKASSQPQDSNGKGAKLGVVHPFGFKAGQEQSITPQSSSTSSGRSSPSINLTRRVRTLYACVGEHSGELSFEPNQIITNVRPSVEPGWLEGTLNGKAGLVPENYVEYLP